MYDGGLDLVEVFERMDHLHDDTAGLPLGDALVLLEVEVQVVTVAVLQHRAEPGGQQTPFGDCPTNASPLAPNVHLPNTSSCGGCTAY